MNDELRELLSQAREEYEREILGAVVLFVLEGYSTRQLYVMEWPPKVKRDGVVYKGVVRAEGPPMNKR